MSEEQSGPPFLRGWAKRAVSLLLLLGYGIYMAGFLLQYGPDRLVQSPPLVEVSVPTIVLLVAIRLIDR